MCFLLAKATIKLNDFFILEEFYLVLKFFVLKRHHLQIVEWLAKLNYIDSLVISTQNCLKIFFLIYNNIFVNNLPLLRHYNLYYKFQVKNSECAILLSF